MLGDKPSAPLMQLQHVSIARYMLMILQKYQGTHQVDQPDYVSVHLQLGLDPAAPATSSIFLKGDMYKYPMRTWFGRMY